MDRHISPHFIITGLDPVILFGRRKKDFRIKSGHDELLEGSPSFIITGLDPVILFGRRKKDFRIKSGNDEMWVTPFETKKAALASGLP